jgi:fatty-acyl-CoA synthase
MPGVVEVCVISADDPKFGETPAAIVHAPGAGLEPDAVTAYCKERLAGYKVPRRVIVQDVPLVRMASGKIARRQIRDAHPELTAAPARLLTGGAALS